MSEQSEKSLVSLSKTDLVSLLGRDPNCGEAWYLLGTLGGCSGLKSHTQRGCYENAVTLACGAQTVWAPRAWAALGETLNEDEKIPLLGFDVTRDMAFFVAHKLAKAINDGPEVKEIASTKDEKNAIASTKDEKNAIASTKDEKNGNVKLEKTKRKLSKSRRHTSRSRRHRSTSRSSRKSKRSHATTVPQSLETQQTDISLALAKRNAQTQDAAKNQRNLSSVVGMVVSAFEAPVWSSTGRHVMTAAQPLESGASAFTLVSVVPILSEIESQYGAEFAKFQQQLKSGVVEEELSSNVLDLKSMMRSTKTSSGRFRPCRDNVINRASVGNVKLSSPRYALAKRLAGVLEED